MTVQTIQLNYNAGELSPLLGARVDLPAYHYGCATLKNMLVYPHGPTFRRPPTEFIAETKTHSSKSRLIPFVFSNSDAYLLEFGAEYIRFYRDGGQVLDDDEDIYEVSTDFAASELSGIQYEQTADLMYLVHNSYWPQKLTRTDHASWALADIGTDDGPFLLENDTDITIEPSGTSGSITLTASDDVFDEDHVGALWRITQNRATTRISGSLNSVDVSDTIAVEKGCAWKAYTHANWTGTIELQRSYDGTNWEYVAGGSYWVGGGSNLMASGVEEEDDALYRFNMTAHSAYTCRYNFHALSYSYDGVVQITAYTSATVVTATVLKALQSTDPTTRWTEGAWSPYRGYPSAITFFQQRLALGSAGHRLPRLWLSENYNFEKFLEGVDADDAIAVVLASARQDPIMWLADCRKLLIGAGNSDQIQPIVVGSELHSFGPAGGNGAVTPENLEVLKHNYVIYVERGGRNLRFVGYSWAEDTYGNENVTQMAEHITASGIIAIAFQKRPQPIIWCVLTDGSLISVTFDNVHKVAAWAAHPMTNGSVESVAVIPGCSVDAEDQVWLIVRRTINGSTKRYVERMMPQNWGTDDRDAAFLDSCLKFDGGDAVNISNISVAAGTGKITVTVSTWPADGDGTDIADGDHIILKSITGMTELNDKVFTVSDADSTAKTLILKDSGNSFYWNGSAYTAYVSGGTIQKVEKTFSNLGHLQGQTCGVLADGYVLDDVTVSGAAATISDWSNKVYIGLSYDSQMTPMDLVVSTKQGTSRGRKLKITECAIDFYKTGSCKFGPDADNLVEINFASDTDTVDEPTPLFTGLRIEGFKDDYKYQPSITIVQDKPLPLTIRALIPTIEIA